MANVDWNGIQQRFAQEAQAVGQQQQAQQQYDDTPVGRALSRASQQDPQRLVQLAGFLTQGANSQYSSQQAMLGQARDQQIAELQRSYASAVEEGKISIREAEKAFEEQALTINTNSFNDSERTAVMAQDMGLQNSAQAMGMHASDTARQNSLLSKNISEREQRINNVKDRINTLTTQKDLDITSANSNYNYGIANQRGQIAQGLLSNMFNMGYEDHNQRQQQMAQISQLGLQDELQREQMAINQQYGLANMAQQNQYQLGQMGVQQGYDMQKMGVQQQNELAQMAQAFGYDINKMSLQQQYQMAQMAQSFGYDSALQSSSQQFQAGQNELERGFKMQQFQAEQQALADNYQVELQRELSSYREGTPEYELRKNQMESSYKAVQLESQAKLMSDVMGKAFADHVGNPPKNPGKGASKKQVDSYNKQVNAYNAKMNAFMQDPSNISTFMSNLEEIEYKAKKKSPTNPFESTLKGMFGGSTKGLDDFLNTP